MGVELAPDEVAYRCNLVTLGRRRHAWSTSRPVTSRASRAIRSSPRSTPRSATGATACASIPGVEYRHLCVVPSDWADADCVPPHDLTGKPAVWPTGPAAPKLQALMDASRAVVRDAARAVGSTATQIWLWGQGVRPRCRASTRRFGVERSADVGRRPRAGSRCAHRHRGRRRPGRDRGLRQRLRRAARRVHRLARRPRLLPAARRGDRRGRAPGRVDEKVDALERWDADDHRSARRRARRGSEPYRILLLPDHATPCAIMTHTVRAGAVPAVRLDARRRRAAPTPSPATADAPPVAAPHAHGPARRRPSRDAVARDRRPAIARRAAESERDPARLSLADVSVSVTPTRTVLRTWPAASAGLPPPRPDRRRRLVLRRRVGPAGRLVGPASGSAARSDRGRPDAPVPDPRSDTDT